MVNALELNRQTFEEIDFTHDDILALIQARLNGSLEAAELEFGTQNQTPESSVKGQVVNEQELEAVLD